MVTLKRVKKKLRKKLRFTKSSRALLILIVVVFGLIGSWLTLLSRADTNKLPIEPETSDVSAPAQNVNDSTASNGKAVRFRASPTGSETQFSLAVIPDTQYAVSNNRQWGDTVGNTMHWIVNNAASKNIKYVLQEGDIQDYPVNPKGEIWQYPYVRDRMHILNGHVPYIIAIGNHDFDAWSGFVEGSTVENPKHGEPAIALDRSTTLFNRYFPVTNFRCWATPKYCSSYPIGSNDKAYFRCWATPKTCDSYPAGSNDNSYQMFSAGGTDWGIISLKYEPTADELDWANIVVGANPNRRFVILTHSFLSKKVNETTGEVNRTLGGNSIWDNFAKKYKNISFVFSGHVPDQTPTRRVDNGDNGNPVHQLLFDYQRGTDHNNDTVTDRDPNTYFRMLYFDTDPEVRTIRVETYSPTLNMFRTEPSEAFTITNAPIGPVE